MQSKSTPRRVVIGESTHDPPLPTSTARAGRRRAGRRRRRRHCAARERVPPTRTMFTLTAKCAVATPVAATRKGARAPRARGASSARERAG